MKNFSFNPVVCGVLSPYFTEEASSYIRPKLKIRNISSTCVRISVIYPRSAAHHSGKDRISQTYGR